MSGGVDSSVVAGLMKMNGYQVIGMTLQLYDYAQINKKPGTCCAGQDIYDAKRVSEKLEIHDHYNTNSYYNDLIGIFDNDSDNDNDDNRNNNKKTKDNYCAIVLLLNDYKNLIGDYNDLIISMICNNNTCH